MISSASKIHSLEFHASCAEGLQEFLSREIKSYGLKILSENRGGVFFEGKAESVEQFILNSRFSSKISYNLFRFKADSPEDLYDSAYQLPWEKIIPENKTFKIESSTKDSLDNSRYALYKLKDSIRDRFRDKFNLETEVAKDNPDILLLLKSNRNQVSIQMCLSTYSVSKRGYRTVSTEAPLKENLAQTLIDFSGWDRSKPLIDPMCGSGTILIEAALLLKKYSPLNAFVFRDSFAYISLFGEVKTNKEKIDSSSIILFGYDIDPHAIEAAKENAANAGVDKIIRFEKKDVKDLTNENNLKEGFIVTNPPYGKRLGSVEESKKLYTEIANVIRKNFSGFNFSVICGDKSLLGYFRLKEEKSLNLTIAGFKAKIVNYKIR
ncbi:MAG: N-6 DNA methylase [Leptospira sp.]|nr:N-6 DNA methylase [Leptospira sp.]